MSEDSGQGVGQFISQLGNNSNHISGAVLKQNITERLFGPRIRLPMITRAMAGHFFALIQVFRLVLQMEEQTQASGN